MANSLSYIYNLMSFIEKNDLLEEYIENSVNDNDNVEKFISRSITPISGAFVFPWGEYEEWCKLEYEWSVLKSTHKYK